MREEASIRRTIGRHRLQRSNGIVGSFRTIRCFGEYFHESLFAGMRLRRRDRACGCPKPEFGSGAGERGLFFAIRRSPLARCVPVRPHSQLSAPPF
jgi:hypothetical protein